MLFMYRTSHSTIRYASTLSFSLAAVTPPRTSLNEETGRASSIILRHCEQISTEHSSSAGRGAVLFVWFVSALSSVFSVVDV